ncbi:ribosomal protein S5 domain 2-type protein [Naematelia encephala]|uniref:Ribosomal RNA-processing protein 43 n=1 Tax=Naematelia encephala TaxID=71784 RepID=A0A1Y2BMQ1_9TREE|nr:ribosomal protein S5 domain 2-type protein [Naematelia encephala]
MSISATHAAAASETAESSSAASVNAAAVFSRLHPDQYLSRFLSKGFRPDGRTVRDWRDVSINYDPVSTADGSALVRIGETTMICGVKAEIAEPDLARPNDGFVVPNIDLPALCSPRFKPGPPSDEAQTLSNWLNDLIVSSRTLPPRKLCIVPGKAVWAIYIDVTCINYDGNAFDAAVLAVMAALRRTRIPGARWDEVTSRVLCSRTDKYPLPLGRIPLSCSFGVFQSKYLLPDPTAFERPLIQITMTVALDEEGFASLVRHEGLGGIEGVSGERLVGEAWGIAEERVKVLRTIMSESE